MIRESGFGEPRLFLGLDEFRRSRLLAANMKEREAYLVKRKRPGLLRRARGQGSGKAKEVAVAVAVAGKSKSRGQRKLKIEGSGVGGQDPSAHPYRNTEYRRQESEENLNSTQSAGLKGRRETKLAGKGDSVSV